jgi:hypothetical protein
LIPRLARAARYFLANKKAANAQGRGLRTPLVNTPLRALRDCFELAGLRSSDVLVDLGSGTGVVLQFACKTYGCKAIGVELDAALVKKSRADLEANGLHTLATVIQADFFSDAAKAALARATVVFGFQTPQHGGRELLPYVQSIVPPSVRILSYAFDWGAGSTDQNPLVIETANWQSRPGLPCASQQPAHAYLWHGKREGPAPPATKSAGGIARPGDRRAGDDSDDGDNDSDRGSTSSEGVRGSLAGYLLSLLSRGSEEIVPWLSWKVFDVLFALLMLRLAKRFKCIRYLQELEVL